MEEYYFYRPQPFDSIASIARMFLLTEQEVWDTNPQWKNLPMVLLRPSAREEVLLPLKIDKVPFFFLYRSRLTRRRVSTTTAYSPGWFPPKPAFGSPSKPLSTLLAKLGNPKYKVKNPGAYHSPIEFTDGWATRNISKVYIKQLDGVPLYSKNGTKFGGNLSFYKPAHLAIKNLFEAWEKARLVPKILTFEGSFNPRVIKSGTTPSNHSFGTAFDINGTWNPEGHAPAGIGKEGCLMEFVPIANEHKFYWGGFYKDGMHFEYAGL